MFDHRLRHGWEREPVGIRARVRGRYKTERVWSPGSGHVQPALTIGRGDWARAYANALDHVAAIQGAKLRSVYSTAHRVTVIYEIP